MSVSRAGPGAVVGAGTAGVHPAYGREVCVVEDGQLQGQPALYAAQAQERATAVLLCYKDLVYCTPGVQ